MSRQQQPKRKNTKSSMRVRNQRPTPRLVQGVPGSVLTNLKYVDPTLTRTTTAQFYVFTMRMNDVYDPDPVLGSASVGLFSHYSDVYQRFRVHKIKFTWFVQNMDTNNPLSIFVVPSGSTNTVPLSVTDAMNLAENPLATKTLQVAPKLSGQGQKTLSASFDLGKVFGSPQEYIAKNDFCGYCAPAPASPAAFMYLQFIAYGPSANLSIISNLRISYLTEFYSRQLIAL